MLPKVMFSKNKKTKDKLCCWCKDCCRKNASDWRKKYPNKAKEKAVRWQRNIRIKVLNLLSDNNPSCSICGFNDPRALEVDHIRGGGNIERKKLGGNWIGIYRKIVNTPIEDIKKEYQILCANCNKIKNYEDRGFNVYNNDYNDETK